MTRQDKQALAKWLEEIAADLEGADAKSEEYAKEHSARHGGRPSDRWPYQTGVLGAITREKAHSLRAAIRAYLETKRRAA